MEILALSKGESVPISKLKRMLRSFLLYIKLFKDEGIHVMVVVDGDLLPGKKIEHDKRNYAAVENLQKAQQFQMEGNIKESMKLYRKSIRINSQATFNVSNYFCDIPTKNSLFIIIMSVI